MSKLLSWVVAGLLGAAVADQLRRRPDQRTWVGRVGGIVPYDLRVPTLARARSTFWSPDNPHLLVPNAFGVGWTLNVGRLAGLLRQP